MAILAHLTPSSEQSGKPDPGSDLVLRQQLSDLLSACAEGNRAAFRRLYDLSSHRVFGIVLAVLRDRVVAEEVAQEVYVQIWRQAGRFDAGGGNAVGWIASIARNRAIDRLRADRARGFVTYTDDVPDIADLSHREGAPLDVIAVSRAMAALRPEYRKVLLLSYFKGYTQAEMSDLLDLPLGTIKSWMTRGLSELREALS